MEISPSDYNSFRQILERQSGILLGDNKQYLVASRLGNFVKESRLKSFAALVKQIEKPAGRMLLQQAIDQMTTNETLWYRDSYPFEYMKRHLIPELTRKTHYRIWSAACSSGQEPFSLAMLLEEILALSKGEIIGTDLSARVIDKAKCGLYQDIELRRGLPHDKLKRFFSQANGDSWVLKDAIREAVKFQSLNLLELPYTIGKFDVIFCRNVLIYFSQLNKTRVLNGLIDCLKPGGYLFLGASESLTRDCKPLEMIRCNPGLVYRKP